jgi:hypothetical protein
LTNRAAGIEAKLFHGKAPVSEQKFEKILDGYLRWRASHPDIAKLDNEIDALQVPAAPETPGVQTDKASERLGSDPPLKRIATSEAR